MGSERLPPGSGDRSGFVRACCRRLGGGDLQATRVSPRPPAVGTDAPPTDHLGAPRVVLDTADAQRWTRLAEPFGTTAANQDPQGLGPFTFNLRFPGQYFDAETGLHHNGQRDYDPTLGRFVQPDPAGLEGGVDGYGDAMSRPTSFTDPTGELVPIAAACAVNPVCAATAATALRGISLSLSRCASSVACVQRWMRAAHALVASAATWIRVEQRRAADAVALAAAGSGHCPPDDKCEEQAKKDEQMCRMTTMPRTGARARCWASVQERYGAFKAGRPLPPLVMW